jgi:hypothetical protein
LLANRSGGTPRRLVTLADAWGTPASVS